MFHEAEERNDDVMGQRGSRLELTSETSPLLGMTSTPNSSLSNRSSIISDSMKASSDGLSSEDKKGWNILRDHLQKGDLLVHLKQATEEKACKSRESIRRKAFKEFETGMRFGVVECISAIGAYLLVSVLMFSFVLEPNWTIIDSCYFAVSTFTTLGPGDLTPNLDNNLAVLFTCLYVLLGVACLGIALGVLGDNLLDTRHQARQRASKMAKYQAMTMFDFQQDGESSQSSKEGDSEAGNEPRGFWQLGEGEKFLLLLSGMMILALWIGMGSKWTTLETIYYLVVTGCTLGYGDLVPVSQAQRFLAVLFIPLACCVVGYYLGFFANAVIERRSSNFRTRFAAHELTQDDLDAMDIHGTGKVNWNDFLVFLLVAMNKIDYELVDELRIYFNRLDTNGSGELCADDMIRRAKESLQSPRRKLELATYKARLLHQAAEKKRWRPTLFRRLTILPSFMNNPDDRSNVNESERDNDKGVWKRWKSLLMPKGESSMESFLSDEISQKEGDYNCSNKA